MLRLDLHEDDRGWFQENWQREKMLALGLPDFEPVQHNLAFNARARHHPRHPHRAVGQAGLGGHRAGVRRLGRLPRGRRATGTTFHLEIDPSTAVFVPRGVGNSYQTLDDDVTYTYLINDHFDPSYVYPALRLDDPTVAIPWPIPIEEAVVSEKDRTTPLLRRRRVAPDRGRP